jgi:peptidyl-prolyl cis-trans isomerase-like protein 2
LTIGLVTNMPQQKHTVFGKLVGGEQVLDALENLPVKAGTERPTKVVKITEVVVYVVDSSCESTHAYGAVKIPRPVRGVQDPSCEETREEG